MITIEQVKCFWEQNPLFKDEGKFLVGSSEFFKEHDLVYERDVFSGKIPYKLLIPDNLNINDKILDLGCGVGFWTSMFIKKGFKNIFAADLTQTAIETTEKRVKYSNADVKLSIQNAEKLKYESESFKHVNCQGVIHHTPNPQDAIKEIHRVLQIDGTAFISVYYENVILRNWSILKRIGRLLNKHGAELKGRGRENIFAYDDPSEIVRVFDGNENPLGRCYSKNGITKLVQKYFKINKIFLNYFPARTLPFRISRPLHLFLSRNAGFMIHLNMTKIN